MKSTRDDACNLIRHWQSEDAQLRCTYASEGVGVSVTGRVAELSDDSALSITGTGCEALIALDGATYDYHGAQDVPSAIQESPGGPFVSALALRLRSGDTFTLAEVRTASSPGDRQH